jgi:hypothetical protein
MPRYLVTSFNAKTYEVRCDPYVAHSADEAAILAIRALGPDTAIVARHTPDDLRRLADELDSMAEAAIVTKQAAHTKKV